MALGRLDTGRQGDLLSALQTRNPGCGGVAFFDFASGRTAGVSPFPGTLPPLGTGAWSLSPGERSLFVVRADSAQSDLVLVAPRL